MDLAVLRLEQGHSREVMALALWMEMEEATVELARQTRLPGSSDPDEADRLA